MATSAVCSSCLRAAISLSVRSSSSYVRQAAYNNARSLSTSTSATSQELFLDFLAPSHTLRTLSSARPRTSPRPSILARRQFSSTSRVGEPAKAVQNPRKDEDGNEMTIEITPRAAYRLSNIVAKDNNPDLCLRVTVESGGCHGFQYTISLTDLSKVSPEDDTVFEGDKGAKVVMDEPSLELLKGSKVDYTMELIGSQFKIVDNPYATSSCGCGTSFDIKVPGT